MRIRIGYELVYEFPRPTPMILTLSVHYSRASDLVRPDHLLTDPSIPVSAYRDGFGNWCSRLVAPQGRLRLTADALINDSGLPEATLPNTWQIEVQNLPEETLVYLLGKYGMEIFDAERISTHSGSIRVFACRKGAYPISSSVSVLLEEESKGGLSSFATYEEFARKAEEHKKVLTRLLSTIKAQGNRIVGLTYPARALTLMQYCGIDQQFLDYITEKSPLKIGKYSPGTHIRILDESVLFSDQPDYGLLLSWHLADEIIPKFKANGFKGKFIIPLPVPRIVN